MELSLVGLAVSTEIFKFINKDGEEDTLMRIKAFKNGNLHINFHSDFIMALNIAHGKIKGWINSPEQAEEEMGMEKGEAIHLFNNHFQITKEALQLELK